MDERGNIRELAEGEALRPGEIGIGDATDLLAMQPKARKEFYRSIRQGLSHEAALACAQHANRAAMTAKGKAP
jgi:hypothetical protein